MLSFSTTISGPRFSARRGLGLLETILALLIAGFFLAGAMLLYDGSQQKRYVRDFHEEMGMVYLAGKTVTRNSSMNAMSTAMMIQANIVPKKYVSGGVFVTPWKGYLVMYGMTYQGRPAMQIWVNNVPLAVCTSMTNQPDGANGLVINDIDVTQSNASTPDIISACRRSSSTTMAFYYTY
ncbi:hypothetical protein ACTVH1_18415 [Gluconobacter cerinus]